ncbi:DUF2927 domain-containing protein [Salipiger thiooxidans]|uniref:DUF2927 domain-containing protein n=1 Tax=Salipiger thiooxidans TaxID=282683 RepID=UPI001CD332DC|nr:DUF2927 domain-containing protein [Salipiger thiooxidans]MCA0848372.1 DUF2927 domain-containing protein [Salipiger thiooxidans]
MRALVLPLVLALASCVPAPPADTASRAVAGISAPTGLPAMKTFPGSAPQPAVVSNRDLERDILELAFTLESGRTLSSFTRFEGPVTLRVTGSPPRTLSGDLDRLLERLRNEARIDIRRSSAPDASITLVAIPRNDIRKHLPQAACFVVPNVSSLGEYLAARNSGAVSWTRVQRRERVAIFLPADAAPQEVRDCLHEEIAQALGPLNDLYRLTDSVFNDDNVHTVLTGYDMTVLRAWYDPALRSGLTRSEVAARLPAVLARVNPRGEGLAPRYLPPTPRDWIEAVQTALGPGAPYAERRHAAERAVRIATDEGWTDHRRGFSHYAMGRLLQGTDATAALQEFLQAQHYFEITPDTALHQAYVASQLAAYAINDHRPDDALALIAPHLATATRHENAALLATLMMLKAEALELAGRPSEARIVRMDSLGWARYGFGSDWAVRAKMREIAALNPARG